MTRFLIFGIISIIIIFILWKGTIIYGAKRNNRGYCTIDYSKGKSFEFTYLHLFGLLFLLIPIFNVFWFFVLIGWYIKKSSEDTYYSWDENSVVWKPDKLKRLFFKLYDVLNKKI